MKNIIMLGVFEPQSTNVSMAKAFIKKGYNVIPISYRSILSEYNQESLFKIVEHAVKKYKPVFTVFCKCNDVNSNIVSMCNDLGSKTILFMMDAIHPQMLRYPEIIEHAKRTTFSCVTGGAVRDYFEECGVINCYHIFDGVDTDLFKPVEPSKDYECDISFIGTRLEHRDNIKKLLEEAGYTTRFYGKGYNNEIYNEEFSIACCSSKYALSVNTICLPDSFSNRLLRLLGCKVCTLHFDPTGTVGKYFEDGKEIILFKTAEELITKLKYLNNYGQIAENGYKKVINEFTWDKTVERILEVCKNV